MPTSPAPLPAPHLAWTLPFLALLLAIALLPLGSATKHWWEHNRHKLLTGLILGGIVLAHYGFRGFGVRAETPGATTAPGLATVAAVLEHAILDDYVPFIVLLFTLYLISGGLQVRGDLVASPQVNAAFLAAGAGLASLIGTTGASMVLIRPLLQTNRQRSHVRHTVVFFIFLVSNIGGCLLPLGDPPLFLGYLQGVPFSWTLGLARPWLFCVGCLLAVYYVWDRLAFHREPIYRLKDDLRHVSPLRLRGSINLLWLGGVVLAVSLLVPGHTLPGSRIVVPHFTREVVLLVLAGLSLATTPRGLRWEIEFSYGAWLEVACLFLGIFLTMQVPIEILRAQGATHGLKDPWHFFWAAGGLSSFLDNAPTYLVFFETAKAIAPVAGAMVVALNGGGAIRHDLLVAISLGSVFMGANTYIGNGPNFMVKSIAEKHGVAMPGFFGYMAYSAGVLVPLFALVSSLFIA